MAGFNYWEDEGFQSQANWKSFEETYPLEYSDYWWDIACRMVDEVYIFRDYPLAISEMRAKRYIANIFKNAARKHQRGFVLDLIRAGTDYGRGRRAARRMFRSFDRDRSFYHVKKWHRKRWNLIEAKIQHVIVDITEELRRVGGSCLANEFIDVPTRVIEDAMWAIAKKLPGPDDSDDEGDDGEYSDFDIDEGDYLPAYDEDY
jgi:hypothetical protein